MVRKSIVSFLFATIALVLAAPAAIAQQQSALPKQTPLFHGPKEPAAAAEAAPGKSNANTAGTLPLFSYTVTSSRDGNTYSGVIVGDSPFTDPRGSVRVPAQIVPVIIVTNSVFAGVVNGDVVTVPGVTVFDPSKRDDSCLTPPNDKPLDLVQESPIYHREDINFGGTDLGVSQATDAFQRANFFQPLNGGNANVEVNTRYHVNLSPVTTLAPIVINIPAGNGIAYPSAAFGGCPTGVNAIVDFAVYKPALFAAITTTLGAQGVNPGTFPMFVTHNVVECVALAAGVNCGDVLNPNSACCIIGFHSASGQQTIGTADFDTSAIFISPIPDVLPMSHEVGEWMNDPFGNNPTPAWGHTGQVGGCQSNLEVGDPLTPTQLPAITGPTGFAYHLQELAFFSWFYGAPSIGIHGFFSDNGTFTTDAGPVCQ